MRRGLLRVDRIVVAALLAAAACSSGAAGSSSRPRIVSVSKQINEFMYAIGAQDVLVARDLTSIYPPAITRLPSVGYHRALSADGIISMKPTLFLTDGNVGPDAVLAQLRKVGIPILVLKPGSTPDSAEALLQRLGQQFHRESTADVVLAEWKRGMDRVRSDSARFAATSSPRPRVLVMHFGQIANDYLAVGRGSPADRMIAWAGGVNAIDSTRAMTRLTPELIARAAPDVIIATDVGFDRVGSADKFAAVPGVALTPAAKTRRIHRIDESEIMYFGPRTPAAARKIGAWLHADNAAAVP